MQRIARVVPCHAVDSLSSLNDAWTPLQGLISSLRAGALQNFIRNATKKAGGSTQNGRDSQPKNLGPKKSDGQRVVTGNIIVRQRGFKFHPGLNVESGRDHTLYSLVEGKVAYRWQRERKKTYVHVLTGSESDQAIQMSMTKSGLFSSRFNSELIKKFESGNMRGVKTAQTMSS